MKKIDQKIVGVAVVHEPEGGPTDVEQKHEKVERQPVLQGSTYRIGPPLSEHSIDVTINDIILNEGTEHELRRPFEIFIDSKNIDHSQWILALTRIISAVFRKGGDVTFLVAELHSVIDPEGGYRKKGGRYVPSLVAEIGDVLETHLKRIGFLVNEELDEHTQRHLAVKRQAAPPAESGTYTASDSGAAEHADSELPVSAEICRKCRAKAVVSLDSCLTCLSCGDSKCG